MQFTRIKNSFSQNRRIPRLGRIRLGLKVAKTRQDGSTVEYPTEVNYFVTTPEVQAVYGPKPTELDIMLPSENEEAVFPQSLAWFGRSKGLRCKGDGENAERLNEQTGQWEPRKCPCEHYRSKENPKGDCTEQGILMFILPKVSMGGTYQLRTGSYNSVVDVNSGLDYVRALIGRISMVPLKLRRVARETHNDGKKQIHYTLSLTLDATVEGVNQLRGDTSRILSHAQLQIEGPVEENPSLDPPDITETGGDEPDDAEQIDAAALAEMEEKELDAVKARLDAKRQETSKQEPKQEATPEPKPEAKPHQNNGKPKKDPINNEADWQELERFLMQNPDRLAVLKKVLQGMQIEGMHELTKQGRKTFMERVKTTGAEMGVKIFG